MDKKQTFADLGIPFRLYEAPVETCSTFLGQGECSVCQRQNHWIFLAGIGDSLVVLCPNCSEPNPLRCDDKDEVPCKKCATPVTWPLAPEGDVRVCYDCLRAGRVWLTQDTALGMVRFEDAERGWTHGTPGEVNVTLESRPNEDSPNWREFAIDPDDAQELGRTPSYTTWQGEQWPFHCGRVMVYIGEPLSNSREEVDPAVATTAENIIEREGWDTDGLDLWQSTLCAYVFRCPVCGALDGHADAD